MMGGDDSNIMLAVIQVVGHTLLRHAIRVCDANIARHVEAIL